jgi:lysophospholipase L1-like esterase
MQKYTNNVQNRNGKAVANALVTVKTLAGVLATIYSDNGVTTQTNPITTDANGIFSFYAADGRYSLTIESNGLTSTISDILLEDPQDGSDAVFGDVSIDSLTVTGATTLADLTIDDLTAGNITANNINVSGEINLLSSSFKIVAGKGQMMTALAGGASDSNFTQSSGRTITRIGPGGARDIRLVFSNFYRASGEQDGANAINVKAAIEIRQSTGPNVYKTYPVAFNGLQEVTIDPGAGMVISDPIGVAIPANTIFAVRTEATVASGEQFPVQCLIHASPIFEGSADIFSGENFVKSTGPSVVYDTGFISGSATRNYGAYAIIGKPLEPMASVVIYGDSIADGSGDTTTSEIIAGEMVGMSRGMVLQSTTPGIIVPYVKLTKAGDSLNFSSTLYGADNSRTWTAFTWATHVICNLGNNDISGGSLVTIQNKLIYLWDQIRRSGALAYHVTMFPRTTGTFTSAGGQTIAADYGVGELRDQLNDWLRNTAVQNGLVDGIIDPQDQIEDSGNPGKWISSPQMTADGTHPTATGHQLVGEIIRQTVATFS